MQTEDIVKALKEENSKTIVNQFNQLKAQRILFVDAATTREIFKKANYSQHAADCERTYTLTALKDAAEKNERAALMDNLRARNVEDIEKIIKTADKESYPQPLDFGVKIDVLEIHDNIKIYLKSLNNQQGIGLLGIQATNAVFEQIAEILIGTSDNYSWTNRIEVINHKKIIIKEYANIRYVSFKNIRMEDGNMKVIPSKSQTQPILLNLTQYHITLADDALVKAEVHSTETYFSTQITAATRNRILFYLCCPYNTGLKKELQDLTNQHWNFLNEYFATMREQVKATEINSRVIRELIVRTNQQPIYQPVLLSINPLSFEKKSFDTFKLDSTALSKNIREFSLLNSLPNNSIQITLDATSEFLNIVINFEKIIAKDNTLSLLHYHQLNLLELDNHNYIGNNKLQVLLNTQKNSLQHLTIRNCPRLKSPDFSGLKNLKSLSISNCKEIDMLTLPNYPLEQLDLSDCRQLKLQTLLYIKGKQPNAKMPYQIDDKPEDTLFYIVEKNNNEITQDDLRIVKYLITENSKLLTTTRKGNTPLHFAAKNGHFNLVQLMVPIMQIYNLDIAVNNEKNKTAENLAEKNKHARISNYLKNASFALENSEKQQFKL